MPDLDPEPEPGPTLAWRTGLPVRLSGHANGRSACGWSSCGVSDAWLTVTEWWHAARSVGAGGLLGVVGFPAVLARSPLPVKPFEGGMLPSGMSGCLPAHAVAGGRVGGEGGG